MTRTPKQDKELYNLAKGFLETYCITEVKKSKRQKKIEREAKYRPHTNLKGRGK